MHHRKRRRTLGGARTGHGVIKPSCATGPAISIEADGVQVRRLFLRNHADTGIAIVNRTNVKLRNVHTGSPASGNTAPVVNIEQSTRITVTGVLVPYFDGPLRAGPVGFRIANIPAEGLIKVQNTGVAGFDVGFLLLNAADHSVSLSGSGSSSNNQGIVLINTVGASVLRNIVTSNVLAGVTVDATSMGNLFASNRIESTTGIDVSDAGTGNCWHRNLFATGSVPPCP